MTGNTLYVNGTSALGTINVTVSFPSYTNAANVTQTTSLQVTDVQGDLTVSYVHYPTGTTIAALKKVHCSSLYQQATVSARISTTLGQSYDVTSVTTFASLAPAIASTDYTVVTGESAGSAVITASYWSNTYTGNTSVSAGTLLVNGSTHSSSAVDVTGATLGGTGTIGGNVTVGSGATIAGGLNGVGTLNLSSSMTLNGNSTFSADISGAVPGTEYNRLQLSGAAVTLNGVNNLALNLTYTPTDQQLFFLIVGASSITGRFDSLNGVTTTLNQNSTFTLGGQEFTIGYSGNSTAGTFSGGNDLVLQASAVPEPSTWALMLMGLFAGVFLIRRKKFSVLR
jgi:autotransporter-associated beta strand protein